MSTDSTPCPGCGAPMSQVAHHGISYECANCGGRIYGLSPFERMLIEGAGVRLWVSSQEGPASAPCPFCSRPMRRPDPADSPDGLLLCHTCQEVFVPASAADWISAHAVPGAPLASPVSLAAQQCGNCGAPLQPDEFGRCRYCHAQVTTPEPAMVEAPRAASPTGNRFLDSLGAFLTQPVE